MLADVFAVYVGRPWYIVPVASVLVSFTMLALDLVVELPEYRITGYDAFISGVIGLFLIKGDPFLRTGIMIGGMILLFAFVGIIRAATRGSIPQTSGWKPGPGREAVAICPP